MAGQRPTYVEIDLGALRHNFAQVRAVTGGRRVLAVVKADAYGHGAVETAHALEQAGADLFGVAMVEEGEELRRAGIVRPILVLGGVYPGQEEELLAHDLTPCLFDLATLQRLATVAGRSGRRCAFHLKLDTGMGRLGFLPDQLDSLLAALAAAPGLTLAGVLTHFALADEPGHPVNALQVARFRELLARLRAAGFAPPLIHASNSAATFTLDLPECTLVRPGIALYGALPSEYFRDRLDLRPVMSFRSRIAQLKEFPAGAGISYAHRFVTDRPSRIAAVPVGYADGYNRRLTGQGEVLIRGRRAPLAGTVCMDWILVDVTAIPGAAVGDEVTLLGRDNGSRISAEEWAEKIGTISYEVFCQISKRVPRVFLGGMPTPEQVGRQQQVSSP